jgi:fluoroquinolone transport system permease protein
MLSEFKSSLKADIKFIVHDRMLLWTLLALVILILLLKLAFPLISGFIFLKTGFRLQSYYTIVAITLVAIIPMLSGIIQAFVFLTEDNFHLPQLITSTPAGRQNALYRMIALTFLSFILLIFSIILTNPVPTEGWLRTIFVSVLMSIQSPVVFLFIISFAGNRAEGLTLSTFYGIFLATVPLGLLLHHPWNYFIFFSPLYWISWAWVTSIPAESLIYGAISIIITIGWIFILFRIFLKRLAN